MATVESIMSRALLTVETTTALTEAAQEMHSHAVGAVLVLAGGRLEGILTERDILRAVATGSVEGTRVAAWKMTGSTQGSKYSASPPNLV